VSKAIREIVSLYRLPVEDVIVPAVSVLLV